MNLIEVIPLASLPQNAPQLLSYFSSDPLNKGAVVEVKMGNRTIPAVVVASQPITNQKILIKKSDFQLKKISRVLSHDKQVSDLQFKIALWLARHYSAPLSLCLKTVLPPFFLKKKYPPLMATVSAPDNNYNPKQTLVLSRARQNADVIESTIDKIVRAKKQILLILPDMTTLDYYVDCFSGHYQLAIIHSGLSVKQLYENYTQCASGEASLIIGTRLALMAPYKNLKQIIIDDPSHEFYKSDMTPKYHASDLAHFVAGLYQAEIMELAGIPDIKRHLDIINNKVTLKNTTSTSRTDTILVDTTTELKTDNFSIFSRQSQEAIKDYLKKDKKILIFSSRKGYASTLICGNCGLTAKCPNCSLPMKVHKIPEQVLLCHHCQSHRPIPSFCPNCNSSNIKAVGIPGSQKIYEAVNHLTGEITPQPVVEILDLDTSKAGKEEKLILDKLPIGSGSILIASPMIFSHRYTQKFDLIVVPNADSLANTPDFQTEERLLYQVEKLYDFRPEKIIIQTHNPASTVMAAIASKSYKDFYENELAARETLFYPPFSRLAKLSFGHNDKAKAFYNARVLGEKLKMVIAQLQLAHDVKMLGPSPAFIEREKSRYTYNLILKINPDFKIEKILKFVPVGWSIDLDPRSIL